ncbi:uncharacterized protein LAJ45_10721 [Morchella importuna]|uniref:uncharacterized protein n=1 Tax=Morchella importuna TaxID=1174673 RepID=UPI001E8CF907|nr:uncharacterized protein LAJ45_10721 [Morchella importuna]KAH8145284.1 hypothetical protein LAJ45_10721 [Morchella importuna]
MCEVTRIHYVDCPHTSKKWHKLCTPYLIGPQDRSCPNRRYIDTKTRSGSCKVCKPRPVKTMWVEPGTFVADDRYPVIRSMRELRTAIRRKPASGAEGAGGAGGAAK